MDALNEQIDRNDLLASTRAVYVNTFADGLDGVIKKSAEALFAKADRSPTAQAQRRMLEARGVLEKKSFDIKVQMKKALEKLLHRSFQTTYSNYRPSFSNSLLDGPISLIDTSAFEDELRFNSITDRFRNEAGEQLRDLNIRIALLFEQDNIRERENPFRPYLFSRAILKAIENIDAPPELHLMLTDQLADEFVAQVAVIYGAVNEHLAENGIAAQLMKPKRSPESRRPPVDDDDEFQEHHAPSPAAARRQAGQQGIPGQQGQPGQPSQPSQPYPPGANQHGGAAQAGGAPSHGAPAGGAYPQQGGFANSGAYPAMGQTAPQQSWQGQQAGGQPPAASGPQAPSSAVERLFSSVRAMASRPFRGGQAASQQHAPLDVDTAFPPHGFEHSAFAPQGGAGMGQAGHYNANPGGVAGGGANYPAPGAGHVGGMNSGISGGTSGGISGGISGGMSGGGAGGMGQGGNAAGGHGVASGAGGAYHSARPGATQAYVAGGVARGGAAGNGGPGGFSGGAAGAGAYGATGAGNTGAGHGSHGGAGGPGTQGIGSGGSGMPPGSASGAGSHSEAAHAGGAGSAAQGGQGSTGPGAHGVPGQYGQGGASTNGANGANLAGEDGGGTGAEGGADTSDRARPSWLSGKKAVGDILRRFFAGSSAPDDFEDYDDSAEGHGEPAPLRAAPGLLAGTVQRLIRHSTPATPDMYSASGEIRNLIMERRSGLNEVANNLKEQMTIDIVSMLFEFILRDTQVPAEVRAQLGRLQFLVLKIALRDESLLTTKAHPARMLVNRIGSISLGLKQVDPSGVAVTAEICRIVEAILADETENPNLFLKMLDDLDTFIARELLTQEKGVSVAVEAVEHAESRTLRLAHTSAQVSEALLGLTINDHLREFLENDWSRAIEYAERNNPAIAAEYRALIPDLLWSVLPKVSEGDRQQLLALLPPILKTIHGGMEPIGWPAANKQTLMDWLFDAHTLVLRGNSSAPPPISFSAIHAHFQKFVDNPESVQPSAPGKVSPTSRKGYLEDAMRELDARINMLDHFFDDDPELQAQLQAQEDAEAAAAERGEDVADEKPFDIAERLRVGVAIEVNLGGKPSKGKLNWINQNASNMVLTLADQSEPSMISARMFQRLLRNDRVRFLEDEPVFERAVESLLAAADD